MLHRGPPNLHAVTVGAGAQRRVDDHLYPPLANEVNDVGRSFAHLVDRFHRQPHARQRRRCAARRQEPKAQPMQIAPYLEDRPFVKIVDAEKRGTG